MMAHGPQGFIRTRGATSWDELSMICLVMVRDWEWMPKAAREAYAYRLAGDR